MATPVLPASIVNKIVARNQAARWYATLKEVRTFSAYCCDINSSGIMGVAKQPVPIISITPNPVCLGEAIDWDLTDSYAPGSTISAWTIAYGDGASDTGANIATASGSHTYAAAGGYTITVTIEEGLGKTTEMEREVNVMDCSEPPARWFYAATDGQGVWFLDRAAGSTTWTERNGGLSGNALYVRSIVMKPGDEIKPDAAHELWAATLAGIYKSTNGGRDWQKLTLGNTVDGVAEANLDWHHVVFDPNDPDVMYIEASYEA